MSLLEILKGWVKVSETPIGILFFPFYLIIVLTFYGATRCLKHIFYSLSSLNPEISNQIANKYCDPNSGILGFIVPLGNFVQKHFWLSLLISSVIWVVYKLILYKIRENYPNFLRFE